MKTVPSDPEAVRSRNWSIAQLPGISAEDQAKLADYGIHTTFDLLKQTKTAAQKQAIASKLQTHIQHVTKWVALADLARIPSVGCDYCGLLLHAGIVSPALLAQVSLPRVHRQILKLQVATMQRQDLCPSIDQVARWIEQARILSQRQAGKSSSG